MSLDIENLGLDGVTTVSVPAFEDERGFFAEAFNARRFAEAGLPYAFVQDNVSLSRRAGTVRGLHFQIAPRPIVKLVRVVQGAIFDVVVDVRHGSPTFAQHVSITLTPEPLRWLVVPIGYAHGFCSLEDDTIIEYKVTDHWAPEVDRGIAWDDPDLGIDWPVDEAAAILSDKDRRQPRLRDIPPYFGIDGGTV